MDAASAPDLAASADLAEPADAPEFTAVPEPTLESEPTLEYEPEAESGPEPEPVPVSAATVQLEAERPGLTSPPLHQEPWAGLPTLGEPDAHRHRIRRRVLAAVALVVSVALVALAVAAVVVRLDDRRAPSAHDAEARAAVAAASRATTSLLGYDYRSVGELVAKNRPLLTARCAAEYDAAVDTAFASQVTFLRATNTVIVKSAGAGTVTANRVSVLVFADLSSTNNSRSSVQVELAPVSMVMVRAGSDWLVDSAASAPNTTPSCSLS